MPWIEDDGPGGWRKPPGPSRPVRRYVRGIAEPPPTPRTLAPAGPVEAWLRDLLDLALERHLPELRARVDAIDLSAGSKLGEARAFLSFGGPPPDRSAWRRVPDALCQEVAIERVVPMPPTLLVTLGHGTLEAGVGRTAGWDAPLPGRPEGPGVVVVFCSPNTNKPLHIGHLRACFLGMSISRLIEATGIPVRRSEMLSNFGVHMCQALVMHDGVTEPATTGVKPDWFVGDLYRSYHDAVARSPGPACDGPVCGAEGGEWPCLRCRPLHLLRRMADGDPDLLAAGSRLGEWAIEGILATQARVGATYDSGLRESETLALGVETLEKAVADGVCRRRPDGSTYIDIHSTGTTELTLLRSDGTSLVFSMLLAIYLARGDRYPAWPVVELTGEQWRAGRTAMYELLRRIGRADLADTTEGVFFGMVQLGGAVMRSRDGSVLVADVLLDRVRARVEAWVDEGPTGPLDGSSTDRLGVSMLKYHVLRVPRADGFDFDEEAMWVDASGRFGAVLRALAVAESPGGADPGEGGGREVRALALTLARSWSVAGRALARRDPAILVRYVDELVGRGSAALPGAGPGLRAAFARVVRGSLRLLDIECPEGEPAGGSRSREPSAPPS